MTCGGWGARRDGRRGRRWSVCVTGVKTAGWISSLPQLGELLWECLHVWVTAASSRPLVVFLCSRVSPRDTITRCRGYVRTPAHTAVRIRSARTCSLQQLGKKSLHMFPLWINLQQRRPPPGKSCDRWSNHRLLRHMCRDHGERRAGCCGKPIAALHKWGISKIKCWHAGDGERERERGVTNTESWAKMAGKCIKMWLARISYYVFIVFSINPFRFCSIKNDNFLKPTLIFKLFYLKSHGVVFSKHLPNPGRDDSFPCGLQLWCVHCHHVLSERGCETARRYKPLKSQTATTARWKSIRLTLPEHSRTRWSVKSLVRVSLSHVHRLPPSSSGVSSDVSSEVVATGDAWNNTFL